MSYSRMTVYSFECDGPEPHILPGTNARPCGEYESLPMFGTGLRGAVRELLAANWEVKDGRHLCPAHRSSLAGDLRASLERSTR